MDTPSASVLATWQDALAAAGARMGDGRVTGFAGAPSGAGVRDAFLCDLSHLGMLAFVGPDAEAFLHGQLSCDVRGLEPGRVTLGSYNTPKGRALATMLLWRAGDGFMLQLPAELAEPTRRRLAMYILRAKVKAEDRSSGLIRFGVVGAAAGGVMQAAGLPVPASEFSVIARSPGTANVPEFVLRLPGDRLEIVTGSAQCAIALWQRLAPCASAATAACWELQAIRAGIGDVQAETTDQFVPQMLNLDLLGGVGFNKGCYPGQEIVARAHFLGRLKRRMFRALVPGCDTPRAGDELFCPALPGQPVGTIVSAAAHPIRGHEVLAVVQSELASRDDVTWRAPDGPPLEWLPLPYELPSDRPSSPA